MQIRRKATAGTSQSSDLMVVVEPSDTLSIEIESTVKKQYEHLIRVRIQEPLARLGVTAARIRVNDRGALDYAIDARVDTILACTGGTTTAVVATWDDAGALTITLRGEFSGSDAEACVRAGFGDARIEARGPGHVVHPVVAR